MGLLKLAPCSTGGGSRGTYTDGLICTPHTVHCVERPHIYKNYVSEYIILLQNNPRPCTTFLKGEIRGLASQVVREPFIWSVVISSPWFKKGQSYRAEASRAVWYVHGWGPSLHAWMGGSPSGPLRAGSATAQEPFAPLRPRGTRVEVDANGQRPA